MIRTLEKSVVNVFETHTRKRLYFWSPKNFNLIDTPYAFAINLVTNLDLVTVFRETKSVTKSRFHCI